MFVRVVMPFPSEAMELGPHNQIEDVRAFLQGQHKDKYYVYNLTQRSYDSRKFSQRVRGSSTAVLWLAVT